MKNKYEFTIWIDGVNIKIYTQGGFFNHDIGNKQNGNVVSSSLHKHRYTEIHLIAQGDVEYLIDTHHMKMHTGEMLVIPDETYHKTLSADPEAKCIAFQIEKSFQSPSTYGPIPSQDIEELIKEIKIAESTKFCGKVSAYLTQICSSYLSCQKLKLIPVQARDFVIHEFFSQNYMTDITITDLASELNLSPKQTERMILEYTGNTFRNELTRVRMEAARHLVSMHNLSLAEVAAQVGYKTYSGFWRAFNKK